MGQVQVNAQHTPELFDKVMRKDGTVGTVADVFERGAANMFEYETPDGPHRFDVVAVSIDDIDSVI